MNRHFQRTGSRRSQVNHGFDGQLTDRQDVSRAGMTPSHPREWTLWKAPKAPYNRPRHLPPSRSRLGGTSVSGHRYPGPRTACPGAALDLGVTPVSAWQAAACRFPQVDARSDMRSRHIIPAPCLPVHLPLGHSFLTRGSRCLDKAPPAERPWKMRDGPWARHGTGCRPGAGARPMAGIRNPQGCVRSWRASDTGLPGAGEETPAHAPARPLCNG